MSPTTAPKSIAAEAYQVIGELAAAAGVTDHHEVRRALDYFSGDRLDGSLLPFVLDAPHGRQHRHP